MVDDYLELFDAAFSDNPYWAGCYCLFYDDPDPGWEARERAGAHRTVKADRISAGLAYGLLAYTDGHPVGWCNAGPKRSYLNLRYYRDVPDISGEEIGLVMCFVIHPDHRRQAVATSLLNAADRYLLDLGMTVAEAYPRSAPPKDPDVPWTAHYYKGSKDMYERAGYSQVGEGDGFLVMQKRLATRLDRG